MSQSSPEIETAEDWERRIKEKVWASECLTAGEWIYLVGVFHAANEAEARGHAQTPILAGGPIKDALIGLNDAIDLYWNEGRTEGQVKNICYWQFKAKEALAQGPDTSTEGNTK